MFGLEFGASDLGELPEVVGRTRIGLPEAFAAALPGAPAEHEQDGCAEVRGDACVVAEFGRAAHIGEVGAQHDDGVAARFDGMESLDDRGQRRVRVGMDVVVRDADALVVVGGRRRALEKQFEDVVALHRRTGDGTEDPDPTDGSREQFQDADGHRRLAGVALSRRDVDRVGHRSVGLLDRVSHLASSARRVFSQPTVGSAGEGVIHRTKKTPHAPARARLPLLRFRPGGVGLDGAT